MHAICRTCLKSLSHLRADVSSALRRTLPAPPLCAPVLAGNATQLICPKPTPTAVIGLQGKWKVWDVRPSDLLLEDETYLLGAPNLLQSHLC